MPGAERRFTGLPRMAGILVAVAGFSVVWFAPLEWIPAGSVLVLVGVGTWYWSCRERVLRQARASAIRQFADTLDSGGRRR